MSVDDIKVPGVTAYQFHVFVDENNIITGAGNTDLVGYMAMEESQFGPTLRAVAFDHKHAIGWYFDEENWRAIPKAEQLGVAVNKTEVLANGEDKVVITDAFIGTKIVARGPMTGFAQPGVFPYGPTIFEGIVEDSDPIEVTFNAPGIYEVTLERIPFLDTKYEIVAT